MRVDSEQDVRATQPREMVLEFMRQPQRIQGNRPFDRVRGWPTAWRHEDRERVLHDAARDLASSANGTRGVRLTCIGRRNL